MFKLIDRHNDRELGRYARHEAAEKAAQEWARAVKRGHGSAAYLPLAIREEE